MGREERNGTKAVEPPYLYLTTTGRRSGQPREIEIWFTQCAGQYYVIARLVRALSGCRICE
ncbi:MAG: nitroreductase family deazaflavin-dependent oxidoreductase [Deltaproteobacteria bacterium]|nr:nitroreductase family deazaflavin-dependent oxidoreductase [Deltaproteobacteria bacterium]